MLEVIWSLSLDSFKIFKRFIDTFKKQLSLLPFYLSIKWTNKRKMSFTPDPSKQAQEEIFSWKTNKVYHPPYLMVLPVNKYQIKNI